MDIDRVIRVREARKDRNHRPYANYREAAEQCIAAGQDILEEKLNIQHVALLERAVVISYVTQVEVYFRDMLDAIFRICDPGYFLPVLRHVHSEKYTIEDLVSVYQNSIHPLELISSDLSFQNVEKIEKVFSKFLGSGLWSACINLKVRLPDRPETSASFEAEYLEGLKRTFALRHELVHNPRAGKVLTESILYDIKQADYIMFAVDVVLSNMIGSNADPKLSDKAT